MDSRQIFMIVTIVVALSAAMIATPVMAQNMTGGNMTGGNMTGGNMTPATRRHTMYSNRCLARR
jgi:hypothetical protein